MPSYPDPSTCLDRFESAGAGGNPNRLNKFLINLLSNAIKFTPNSGEVFIDFERVPNDARERL